MRGDDGKQDRIHSIVTLDERAPKDHSLRPIRDMVDSVLYQMSGDFEALYSKVGRPSIAPERLLRTLPSARTAIASFAARSLSGSSRWSWSTLGPSTCFRPNTSPSTGP